MVQPINPVNAEMRLAQILGDDYLAQAAPGVEAPAVPAPPSQKLNLSGNMFEDILSKSIEALNGVSRVEMHANELIQGYLRGQVELQDVMMAQSKMSIMVQLAVTTVNAAVTSFKEITQMQV